MTRAAAGSAERAATGLLSPARRARLLCPRHGAEARCAQAALDTQSGPAATLGERHMSGRQRRARRADRAPPLRVRRETRSRACARSCASICSLSSSCGTLQSANALSSFSAQRLGGPGRHKHAGGVNACAATRRATRAGPAVTARHTRRTTSLCRPCTCSAAPARGATCDSPRTPPTTPTCRSRP
jgi:hypothetical protein